MKKNRSSKLLHEGISTFFLKNYPASTTQPLITVTEVLLSPDGATAKAYISFMPLGKEGNKKDVAKKNEALLSLLKEEKKTIKRYLSTHLGKKLRKIPDILFEYDPSGKQASRISQILSSYKEEIT